MKLLSLSAMMLGGALTATVPVLASPAGQAKEQAKPQPKVYAVADAHLDTQWNWTVQTTIREYLWNTISIRDTFVKGKKENFYHGILLGILGVK